ncbi:MAG: riboflavin synthase [Pelagibacteraceae bacterium]|nr:riboflavin synthase [Pelagibacteraceae bacterium]|tara:strand:+ start:47 stop:622 length:576 start_codon:yes stop_codon:yes gene_type:complete
MFSGIIQDIGKIVSIQKINNFSRVLIKSKITKNKLGSSVCCSGICLTVTSIKNKNTFSVDVSPETLKKTNAYKWCKGMEINIEKSLKLGDEISGHFVFGHIDNVGKLKSIKKISNCWLIKVNYKKNLKKFIAQKGSISLNGVSLTINKVISNYMELMLIPHTFKNTTFKNIKPDDLINIEVDMLARYSLNK